MEVFILRKSTFFFDRMFRLFAVLAGFLVVSMVSVYISNMEIHFILDSIKQLIAISLVFGYMLASSTVLFVSQKHK